MRVAGALVHQRDGGIRNGVYALLQCEFAYHSNRIEGSTLTHDQTVTIFERGTASGVVVLDDALEARNHFRLVDYALDHVDEPLTADVLKEMHAILKRGTSDEQNPHQVVGDFKVLQNEIIGAVSNTQTAEPGDVPHLVDELLGAYEGGALGDAGDLATQAALHWRLERIHPFSDGNGRIGRAVMLKELLRADACPLIVTEDIRDFYLRGLREHEREPGYLTDTLGYAQDRFQARYLPLIERYIEDVKRIDGIRRTR